MRDVDDDPYIKFLRFQRKNIEDFGEQLKKLEEIKLKIAEYICERIQNIFNKGFQKLAQLQIGQDMSENQFDIVLKTISDWGPVISLTFYAKKFRKIGLVIEGIKIVVDWTPIINDLIKTGDWNKFTQDVSGWAASFLINWSVNNVAARKLTRGLREDVIAKNIGRALGTLVGKLTDRLIETLNWENDEK
ncbi:MAG: hypothetical protein FWD26_04940 [Treponema sp.]|nr:hypothetical protein [Treponema sp.]